MNLVLNYNVNYEVSSIIYLLIVLAYTYMQYTKESASLKQFRKLIILTVITTFLDVITAIDIDNADKFPWIVNVLSNTAYFGILIYMLKVYVNYILTCYHYRMHKINKYINNTLFASYAILLGINIFTGWFFGFDKEGHYVHGPLYMTIYVFAAYLAINVIYITIRSRKFLNRRQIISVLLFSVMLFVGVFLQAVFFPKVLLTLFTASAAMIIVLFALETPDYKRLEIAMEQLKASSEMLMKAKSEAEEARLEAEEANKAKSSFLASMSHEIRTPINGVLGMNSIILKEAEDPKIVEYARNIDNAGNGLLSLVNDILDFSKIESGRMELIAVEYNLSDVLSACYNMVFMAAKDKGLDLLFENNPTIPNRLYGDEVRIRQIITNLLSNSVKYTQEGMVMLTADWEQGPKEEGMYLVISVKDTGIGIREENIGKLFDAFSRVDQEKNRNILGTGLGLKITKQFIDLMDGEITVSSVYGSGSEFCIRIPQRIIGKEKLGEFTQNVHISSEDNIVSEDDFIAPEGKILVVDDVEMNLKVITGLLNGTELMIDAVSSGAECLEMAEKKDYDIIFLDHMMPGMDGIETYEKLKKGVKGFDLKTPVVMLTANAIQGAKEEYLSAGFTDYLSKPVREQDIKKMILKYLPKEKIESISDNAQRKLTDKEVEAADVSVEATKSQNEFERRFSFLDTKAGMSFCMENEEFYESIIREFRNSSKYEEIQNYYDDADLENYAVLVHGIKSSSLTIGATDISEMAKGLEFAANSKDIEYLKGYHYKFMHKYGELLDNLDSVYG